MAASDVKMNSVSPLRDEDTNGDDIDDYGNSSGCGSCFGKFCFKWCQGKDRGQLLNDDEDNEEPWWIKKMKKVREASELLAGPKWKNFIRKAGRYCNIRKNNKHNTQFQYDPESYALNFDSGFDTDDDDHFVQVRR